jgi:hypothetical protein
MNGLQKFIAAVLPKKSAASMKTESRTWITRCSSCGFARSFWDAGGIRWKAAGTERRYLSCPKCGRAHWHKIYKRQQEDLHAKAA